MQLDEIDSFVTQLQLQVRTLRNFLLPVHALPLEILSDIFSTHSTSPPLHSPSLSDIAVKARPSQVLPITHVCKHWRNTALGCTSLWRSIVFKPAGGPHPYRFQDECLLRSSGAPLDVQIEDKITGRVGVLDKLGLQSARLRKFHLLNIAHVQKLHNDVFRGEAPILESLQITFDYTYIYRNRENEETPEDTLPLLFSGHTPALRRLTLGCFVKFANRFENLVELRLEEQNYDVPSDLHRLFNLLAASPNLVQLAFMACRVHFNHTEMLLHSSENDPLPFPRLRQLYFMSCPGEFMNLVLGRLEPSFDNLAFACRLCVNDKQIASSLPQQFKSRLGPVVDASTLHIDLHSSTICAMGPSNTFQWELTSISADFLHEILPNLLPLHTLRELYITGVDAFPMADWRSLFCRTPALNRLVVQLPRSLPAQWFCALLPQPIDDRTHPAPVLSELCVYPEIGPPIWEDLIQVIRTRVEHRRALRKLRIFASSRHQLDKWKAEGPRVFEAPVDGVTFELARAFPSWEDEVPEVDKTFFGT